MADYYIATMFNPTKSTLLRAIRNNHLTPWPAFTTKSMYLSKRLASVQDHMDQEFENLRSTKPVDKIDTTDISPV